MTRPARRAEDIDGATGTTDVRLAVAAAAAWLVLALCLGSSTAHVVGTAALAALVGLCGVSARAGRHAAVLHTIAAAGFCIALVLIPFAGRLWAARASPLHQLATTHAAVQLDLITTGDPHPLAASGIAGVPRVAVATEADTVTAGARRWSVSGPVLVLAPAAGWTNVLPGQRVRVSGSLQPSLDAGSTGATVFVEQPPELIGRPPWYQRVAGSVRAGLRRAAEVLPDEERGLLPGLVDGDTAALDPVLEERFRIAGLTHLVAVSGTNCSIVIGSVLLVLRRARVRPWLCALIGGAVLAAFVVLARPSPSVLRAALMAGIALVSLASGRPRHAVATLSAVVLALLVWDPLLSVDPGFAMSALATGALLLVAPHWVAPLRRWHVPPGIAEAVAVAAAAHIVTAPVIAALSGRVSVVAIPANVLAEPAVPAATVFGFAAAVVAPVWAGGAQDLAWVAGWPCRWLVHVADVAGGLDGASVSWPGGATGGLALLFTTLVLLVLARRSALVRVTVIGGVVVLVAQIPVRTLTSDWPPPGWLMVACDVGQGDALVLSAGAHTAVVVDAGPDPVAVDRCLGDLDITDVALLAFTHCHLDHVGGLAGVLHDRNVGQVITGPLADPSTGVWLVHDLLAPRGRTVLTPPVGTAFTVGRVHLEVLGPPAAFHDTRSDPNNSSLVMRATIGDVRILLPGDVEIEAQQAMLAAGVDVTADVLKVPHHGSAYSDPGFLAAVHARVGVISVGVNNDYGHPSPVLLGELAQLGVPVRRTDQDGDVAVTGPRAQLATVDRGVAASQQAGSHPLTPRPGKPSRPGHVVAAARAALARSATRVTVEVTWTRSCGRVAPRRTGRGRGRSRAPCACGRAPPPCTSR